MSIERPKVGLGLLLVDGNKILLGKRRGSHGEGEYAGVGGHLEGLESFEEGLMRELVEEAGPDLKIANLGFLCLTNLRTTYAPKHYVDIGMVADYVSGEPQTMEPDKTEGWSWHDMDNLPTPLFGAVANYVDAYQTGKVYYPE